jgi:UDP-N-acetylglucosamine--N-acetylmuramyl-(pentapeptide) pyrophosphoryl-undecaprenol N-acetylglucosamine transferase
MPSLAVAQVLRARGVSVSFAGSPDRIEAQLVPESGFEFDPFSISGLPRRPGKSQLRAVLLAGRARGRVKNSLGPAARRRPGGGGCGGPDGVCRLAKRILPC